MICYWCKKEIAKEDLHDPQEGMPMHHDCYLEEQEAWAATGPPISTEGTV